jgi:CRISPR-associated protein Cas2
MVKRKLHILAYDISSNARRARALKVCKAHGVGGQKSVHECLLSRKERRDLERALKRSMDKETDRLLVVRMDPRTEIHGLGHAELPPDPPWFYLG